MYSDIAIIGMAGRFPEAKNLVEFYKNLREGLDSVRPLSVERKEATSLDPSALYNPIGYMENIDLFDHDLFSISKGEAMHMDPHQRILLEVVYEAIENAGYDMDTLNGSNSSVFMGDTSQEYIRLASKPDSLFATGNSNAITAARVARFFNFIGNALMVDTACSSSLVALHLACNDLVLGECDYAFVCGANIILYPGESTVSDDTMNVKSADGKTRAFSADANGTGAGEAVCCVILKPLAKAMQDGDIIHAVIKSTAVNQDAQRSGSLTAPSSIAHAELIKRAWQKVEIDPLSISYIETPGTGTTIGDAIELDGICKAFSSYTKKKQFCAISSVKTNIGHTGSATGISSLIKVVLSLKHKEQFPSVHFSEPNPLIDFIKSPIYINNCIKPWLSNEYGKRIAGVSSFGISGTNCHVVLEEAPDHRGTDGFTSGTDALAYYLFTFSSLNREGLLRNMQAIRDFLLQPNNAMPADISYTLNVCRKHYPCRAGIIAGSLNELCDKISDFTETDYGVFIMPTLWFVFSGDAIVPPEIINYLTNKYSGFQQDYNHCLLLSNHIAATKKGRKNLERSIFQYCLYRHIERVMGSANMKVMGTGTGKIVIRVLNNELSLENALLQVADYKEAATIDLAVRILAFIRRNANDAGMAIIEVGGTGEISECFRKLSPEGVVGKIYKLVDESSDLPMLQFVGDMYSCGQIIQWTNLYDKLKYRKTEIPGYQFSPTRCWILDKGKIAGIYTNNDRGTSTEMKEETNVLKNWYNPGFTEIQNKVADAWHQVLYCNELSLTDNFFQLGGHSLLAFRIMNILGKEFKAVFEFHHLLEYPTVEKLAAFIDTLRDNTEMTGKLISQVTSQEHYELSHAQKRLWIIEQLTEAQGAYNVPIACYISGELNVEALNRAFQQLIIRHESLRTGFLSVNGEPRQFILEPYTVDFRISYTDIRKEENIEYAIPRNVRQHAEAKFDLQKPPLIRCLLLQHKETEFVLSFVIHHIVTDGWSMDIILDEMLTLYNAFVCRKNNPLPALAIQYKDFSSWQNNEINNDSVSGHRQYWLTKLSGELSPADFLPDKPRPAMKTYDGDVMTCFLDVATTAAFLQFGQNHNATLFMSFLSMVKVLAFRYTNNEDIIVGTTVAGRDHPGLEKQVGYFVNNLVLRTQIMPSDSLETVLEKVVNTSIQAYEHASYPFDKLVTDMGISRSAGRSPLFDVLVEYNDMSWGNSEPEVVEGLTVRPFNSGYYTSKYDITFRCYSGERLRLDIEYNTCLFSKERIDQLLSHLVTLIQLSVTNAGIQIKDLDYLPGEEKQKLLSFNEPFNELKADNNCISLFEKQVLETPDAIALICEGRTVNYTELNERANQLAHYLKQQYNAKPGTCIGLMADRSEMLVIALLAVLKSGAAYLPVDPSYPVERKKYMLQQAGVQILLTDAAQMMELSYYDGGVFALDVELPLLQTSIYNPVITISGNDLAYIIYTSGSTGDPKGIQIEHYSLANYISWAIKYYSGDGICGNSAFFTTLSFDFTITGILCPLLTGNSVQVYSSSMDLDVILKDIFDAATPCDLVKLTPAHINLLAQLEITCTNIRKIIVGGEELTPAHVLVIRSINSTIEIINEYGPTEATVGCIVKTIDNEEKIMIGRPISNMSAFIIDQYGNLCGIGVPGEICLHGAGVSRGYLGKPELTAEKFTSAEFVDGYWYKTGDLAKWHEDGEIEYLGRKDSQVKIRGYRIEPGEIEACLQQHPQVSAAAVLSKKDASGKLQLRAFVSLFEPISILSLREYLSMRLPEYMVPEIFHLQEAMPITSNGKIDRKLLLMQPDTIAEKVTYIPAAGELEQKLVSIWESVLERDQIGTMDNFFEIGGDSLKTIMIFHHIKKIYPDLKISKLFSYHTISQQAAFIRDETFPFADTDDVHTMQEIQF
jgi:amino acid adenylation domain-containing protein